MDVRITLVLDNMELQLLRSILRRECEQRQQLGTVSDWHDTAETLRAKVEAAKREEI